MKKAVLVAMKQVMKKIMIQMKDNKTINQLKKNQIKIQITLKNNKAIIQVKKNQIMIEEFIKSEYSKKSKFIWDFHTKIKETCLLQVVRK